MRIRPNPLGVIIAGGQSRRFQTAIQDQSQHIDKFLLPFGQTTLLGHIIHRAQKQIPDMMLNVNGDPARVLSYGLDIIGDDIIDGGPLGGILAAMMVAKEKGYSHIITFSSDSPFFPDDYVARLMGAGDNRISLAQSANKTHPVMGIFEVSLMDDLAAYIARGERRVMVWIERHLHSKVVWDNKNPDPFFNINRIEDLEQAERYLDRGFK